MKLLIFVRWCRQGLHHVCTTCDLKYCPTCNTAAASSSSDILLSAIMPHYVLLHLTPWPESASELYRPRDRRLSAKLVPTFADRGCHVSAWRIPYGRILGFLDRSRYIFLVAPQLYSRGWVDPVPDPLLLRKSGSAGNRTRTSGTLSTSPQSSSMCYVLWTTP
jgi:hypothetical protein